MRLILMGWIVVGWVSFVVGGGSRGESSSDGVQTQEDLKRLTREFIFTVKDSEAERKVFEFTAKT